MPWDQLAYWAITVGTNIASAVPLVGDKIRFFLLGGNDIDQNTLLRFYVLQYRNKIGIDVAVEALRNYRQRVRKLPVNKLMEYARICRVERVMRPYLEAVL